MAKLIKWYFNDGSLENLDLLEPFLCLLQRVTILVQSGWSDVGNLSLIYMISWGLNFQIQTPSFPQYIVGSIFEATGLFCTFMSLSVTTRVLVLNDLLAFL